MDTNGIKQNFSLIFILFEKSFVLFILLKQVIHEYQLEVIWILSDGTITIMKK